MGEVHVQMVGTSLPVGALRAWDLTLPLEHVGGTVRLGGWFCDEPKGVISPPLLPLLLEPSDD